MNIVGMNKIELRTRGWCCKYQIDDGKRFETHFDHCNMHKMVCLALKNAQKFKKKKNLNKKKYERPESDERAVEDNQTIFFFGPYAAFK